MARAEFPGAVAAGLSLQIASTQVVTSVDTSTTLGGAGSSDSAIPTQLAVKTYIDSLSSSRSAYVFSASDFENPNNSDWNVNSLAAAEADPTNAGLTIRRFLYTTFPTSGVGFIRRVPLGVTNISLTFLGRSSSTPGGSPRTVGLRLDHRVIPNSGSPLAWSTGATFDAVITNNNTVFYTTTVTKTLVAAGLTANNFYQFEMTRVAPGSGVELGQDFLLLHMEIDFP